MPHSAIPREGIEMIYVQDESLKNIPQTKIGLDFAGMRRRASRKGRVYLYRWGQKYFLDCTEVGKVCMPCVVQ